jgi:phosphatidylglycerol---prolipoprotein diacylglyceryl transferase
MLQIPFHGIDPVFFEIPPVFGIGPIQLRWYGLMYMIGFALMYLLMRRASDRGRVDLSRDDIYDLLFYLILGVMIGGRLGYVLFYDLSAYLADPLSVFAIWRGGMSFHGGLLGTLVASIVVSRRRGWNFWAVADMIAMSAPAMGLVRIGNFINGELYGRETSVPWAMVFPAGGDVGRHPSQLYEAFLEGVVLFLFGRWLYNRSFRPGTTFWGLLGGYGLVRFMVEFVRAPDVQIGFDLGPLTRGQLLSLPMLLVGAVLFARGVRSSSATAARPGPRAKSRRKKT